MLGGVATTIDITGLRLELRGFVFAVGAVSHQAHAMGGIRYDIPCRSTARWKRGGDPPLQNAYHSGLTSLRAVSQSGHSCSHNSPSRQKMGGFTR